MGLEGGSVLTGRHKRPGELISGQYPDSLLTSEWNKKIAVISVLLSPTGHHSLCDL